MAGRRTNTHGQWTGAAAARRDRDPLGFTAEKINKQCKDVVSDEDMVRRIK
jgi:hypothetical protein